MCSCWTIISPVCAMSGLFFSMWKSASCLSRRSIWPAGDIRWDGNSLVMVVLAPLALAVEEIRISL